MLSKKNLIGGFVVALIVLVVVLGNQIIETNESGYFHIRQAAVSGNMSARFDEGTYFQWFAKISKYKNVATIGIGNEKGEGSADLPPVVVFFNDGSKAAISGLVRIKLPTTQEQALSLKRDYSGGYDHFIRSGVAPIINNAYKLAANLRSAQEAYTTLALFQQAIDDQLRNGIYVTRSDVVEITRSTGEPEQRQVTVVVKDSLGNPVRLSNRLSDLGCEVLECVIDVPKFDEKVEQMIAARKDEAMKTELAKQAAIRAKQDALTAEEQGKANVATAKYEEEVIKVKAVTQAEKQFEVEALNAKKALETAKRIEAEGLAQAAANQALVSAGLTPEQKMKMQIEIANVVSKNIAAAPTPQVVFGGGSGGATEDMMKVFGAERAIELVKKFGVDIGK